MEIDAWLRGLGLECYEQAFRDNDIDARSLPLLTADDLKDLGVTTIGHRRILFDAIAELRGADAKSAAREDGGGTFAPTVKPAAERRQLTVLFCDLVGSTELSTQLDPEDLREVIRAYHDCCAREVEAYEGHIARYAGDAVLVSFGYPQAHEDDAERAVRAGLKVVKAIAALQPRPGLQLQARVGIATGPVVVGDLVGEGTAEMDAVVGDTPALAARLQSLAQPGSAVISAGTRRLVGGLFDLSDLGPQALKGFTAPVSAWQVVGESGAENRFEALRGENLTPLIGRENEINLLVDRWARAKEGEGQVVLLEGEAGIGKSRLVLALREQIEEEPHVWLSHYCSPHHRNAAAYPIIGLLERAAGFTREDAVERKLAKLETLLAKATDKLDEAVPLIGDLLGIPTGERYAPVNLSPERKAQRTFEALMQQVEGLSKLKPVLAVYEDVHWADPTTVEALDLLIENVPRLPVLVLITFRPDFERRWTAHTYVTSLLLTRLTRRHGTDLARWIVGSKGLPRDVLDEIVSRADGVPLFVEELTRAVAESRLAQDAVQGSETVEVAPALSIPATLQDSLMARLDRLAPVREVAQLASVIGREFSHRLLAAVARMDEDQLEQALDRLVSAQLVHRQGRPPDAKYRFKHALVQETAYESLLRRRRRDLHGVIANAIETLEGDRATDQAALLAYHFARSPQRKKTFDYALLAGDQAMRIYAASEATTYFTEALNIARELPVSEESRAMQVDAIVKLASVGATREEMERDQTNLEEARALAEGLDDPRRLAQVLYRIGRLAHVRGGFQQAVDFAEQSLALADELGDDALAAPPVNLMGRDCYLMGEYVRASQLLARSVDQMHALGDKMEEATAAGFAGLAFAACGEFGRGLEYTDRGLRLAQELGDPAVTAAAHNYCAVAYCHHGAWDKVISACNAGRELAEQVHDRFRVYLLQYYEGQAYTMSGNPKRGRELLEDSIALAAKFGTTNLLAMGKALLAKCLLLLGEREAVPPLCSEAIELAEATHDRLALGMARRTLAEATAALHPEQSADAEEAILEAIRVQEAFGMRPEIARSHLSHARLLQAAGREPEAEAARAKAAEMFDEMGMAWDLAEAERVAAE